jgi:hypothetical protein
MTLPWNLLPYPLCFLELDLAPQSRVLSGLALLRVEPGTSPELLETVLRAPGPTFPNVIPALRRMTQGAVVVSASPVAAAAQISSAMGPLGGVWSVPMLDLSSLLRAQGHAVDTRPAWAAERCVRRLVELSVAAERDPTTEIADHIRVPRRPALWPNIVASLVPPLPRSRPPVELHSDQA